MVFKILCNAQILTKIENWQTSSWVHQIHLKFSHGFSTQVIDKSSHHQHANHTATTKMHFVIQNLFWVQNSRYLLLQANNIKNSNNSISNGKQKHTFNVRQLQFFHVGVCLLLWMCFSIIHKQIMMIIYCNWFKWIA